MIKKTKSYEIFILRPDNREKISHAHVQKLVESIKSRNMLDLRPILVNKNLEVIDGQHRLLAAQKLGIEIYYQQQNDLEPNDIVRMNIAQSWRMNDYFNYYCHHGYADYLKLKDFMYKHNLKLKVAYLITCGHSKFAYDNFKNGTFKFKEECLGADLSVCWETIHTLKKLNGFCNYTNSSRFWEALLKLIKHPEFLAGKWFLNVNKLSNRFSARATREDYEEMFINVYNYQNKGKIYLSDHKQPAEEEEPQEQLSFAGLLAAR